METIHMNDKTIKKLYQKPKVMSMDSIGESIGKQCHKGGSATGGCRNGVSAGNNCVKGGSAAGKRCKNGGSASKLCKSGSFPGS